ncbi:hypothetical protein Pcaca03_32860 [Pectobacterium carotovorum subsp. carotovorum]|uniref:Uncharacterized protein n=1 Tax=Pectobacterium carotovorum subsp. carotovorum TaxID=555 RepID=A0AAI9L451_PECCC|nr:hypothetical protein SOASR016_31510 [Pectobacterium carotovorum subsp. carotovorum]GLV70842.1 hypothetical protein Pcaca03_32860 [Pectobacterium carotovorum subsp. carotovorum]
MQNGYSNALVALYHARYLSAVADLVLGFILRGFNGSEYQPRHGEMEQAYTIEGEHRNTYGGHRLDPV